MFVENMLEGKKNGEGWLASDEQIIMAFEVWRLSLFSLMIILQN